MTPSAGGPSCSAAQASAPSTTTGYGTVSAGRSCCRAHVPRRATAAPPASIRSAARCSCSAASAAARSSSTPGAGTAPVVDRADRRTQRPQPVAHGLGRRAWPRGHVRRRPPAGHLVGHLGLERQPVDAAATSGLAAGALGACDGLRRGPRPHRAPRRTRAWQQWRHRPRRHLALRRPAMAAGVCPDRAGTPDRHRHGLRPRTRPLRPRRHPGRSHRTGADLGV